MSDQLEEKKVWKEGDYCDATGRTIPCGRHYCYMCGRTRPCPKHLYHATRELGPCCGAQAFGRTCD